MKLRDKWKSMVFTANFKSQILAVTLMISLLSVCTRAQGTSQIRKDAVSRAQAEQAENETYLELSIDTLSKYIYRAYAYSEGTVHQLNLSTGLEPWSFNLFANYDPDNSRVNEVMVNPDFTKSIGSMSFSLGYLFTYYDFDYEYYESLTEKTQEVYFGTTFDSIALTPSAFIYYDYDKGNGTYYELSAEKTIEVKQVELYNLSAISYNYHYFLEGCGWSHAETVLVATTEITEYLDLEGSVRYSYPFDTGIEFGEIEFMDYGLTLSMPLAKKMYIDVGVNHATAFDSGYPDETWAQISLTWIH